MWLQRRDAENAEEAQISKPRINSWRNGWETRGSAPPEKAAAGRLPGRVARPTRSSFRRWVATSSLYFPLLDADGDVGLGLQFEPQAGGGDRLEGEAIVLVAFATVGTGC